MLLVLWGNEEHEKSRSFGEGEFIKEVTLQNVSSTGEKILNTSSLRRIETLDDKDLNN